MAEQACRKQPISRHPLFPVTVALWFGALFGLGAMAAAPSLVESGMLAPVIAPPLAMTTRILLALATAGIGGLIGHTVAHRIATSGSTASQREHSASTGSGRAEEQAESAPLSAFDADPENERQETPRLSRIRSRTLAIEQEMARSDADEHAPSSGGDRPVLDVSEFGLEQLEEARAETSSPGDVPAERKAMADEPETPAFVTLEQDRRTASEAIDGEAGADELPGQEAEWQPEKLDDVPVPLNTAAERIASADLNELSHVELLERLALSMEQRRRNVVSPNDPLPVETVEPDEQPPARGDEPEAAAIEPAHDEAAAAPSASLPGDRTEEQSKPAKRLFDAPGTPVEQVHSVKAASANSQDPEATERALRAALSTLQRMSGAA
ncbi:MAG: hypothetical protein R3E09_10220 [Novosphingobium sp.]|nr:hypothetical protein [Novosphingobium sp.]